MYRLRDEVPVSKCDASDIGQTDGERAI